MLLEDSNAPYYYFQCDNCGSQYESDPWADESTYIDFSEGKEVIYPMCPECKTVEGK
jgi:hypothetical protein